MKALSIIQPWASLIVGGPLQDGLKRVENRTWRPPSSMIGHTIAIHASKKLDLEPYEDLIDSEWFARRFPYATPGEFPRGAIIGTAKIERVVTAVGELPADQRPWWCGPIGIVLCEVRFAGSNRSATSAARWGSGLYLRRQRKP